MSKHFVSNKNESVRLFDNNFLEALSKVHFTVPLYIFIPIIGYFFYIAVADRTYTLLEFFGLCVSGFLAWTFSEYVMHRFVFHYHPSSDFGKKIHFLFHGVHHDYPNDAKRLVLPPSMSIPLATGFYYIWLYFLGEYYLPPFFATFLIGYLVYDISHYAMHHFKINNKFWAAIKEHHMRHHYLEPKAGFGVSSPIWDVIFSSGFKSEGKKSEEKIEKVERVEKIPELS